MIVGREVRRQARQGRRVRLLFEDEARFGCITQPRRCWAPAGIRPRVPAQFLREYTYVFAAVSPHDGILTSLVLPEIHTEMMSLFLAELARQHRDEFLLLVLDGAGWHRAKELDIPTNIRLIPLPPYSPELNPVEPLWDEIREKWFANRLFDSFQTLEDHLVLALASLAHDPLRLANITSYPWIINIPLNAT